MYVGHREEILELIREIKEHYPQKDIWLYTGYQWEMIKDDPIIPYLDVLVDGKYLEAERDVTLPWKGSANQKVIDVQKTLELNQIVLYA